MRKIVKYFFCLTVCFLIFSIMGCDNTKDELKNTEVNIESFTKINDRTYSISVENEINCIDFSDFVSVAKTSKWSLHTDIYAQNLIPSKVGTLEIGDNTYYVLVTDEYENVKLYTLNIRRRAIYTVSFITNNGTTIKSQYIEEGSYQIRPNDNALTKTGYTFSGWDYNFSQKIYKDTTITALWNPINYTITYNLGGGTNSEDNPSAYTIESKITLNNPTKEDFYFAGWYGEKTFENQVTQIEKGTTGNLTLYAKWLWTNT